MAEPSINYPASLDIDYPDRKLDRLTSFFRILTIIPILIVWSLIEPGTVANRGSEMPHYSGAAIVLLPTLIMILFRKKYPRWWFDWNVALTQFSFRIAAYATLLRDEYPSTDEEQAVHIEIGYPDVEQELNRWLPLVKWLLAIPHYIVLVFLGTAAFVCVIIAWFAILFTGTYPKGLFNFVVGVHRWTLRVSVYAFLLSTDCYPPFALDQ